MPPENVPRRLPLSRTSVEDPPRPRSDAVWLLNVAAPMTLASDTLPARIVGGDQVHDLHRVGRAAALDLLAIDDLHGQRAFAFDALDVGARDLDPDVLRRACVASGLRRARRPRLRPGGGGARCRCTFIRCYPPKENAARIVEQPAGTLVGMLSEAYEARDAASQSLVGQRGTRGGEPAQEPCETARAVPACAAVRGAAASDAHGRDREAIAVAK